MTISSTRIALSSDLESNGRNLRIATAAFGSSINGGGGTAATVKEDYAFAFSALGATTWSGSSAINCGSNRLQAVATPTAGTDAANKSYVDGIAAGLFWKDAVLVATTANITLSGTQTIDGIAVSADDRVLVKDQSTGSQNGIYACASGSCPVVLVWSKLNRSPVCA